MGPIWISFWLQMGPMTQSVHILRQYWINIHNLEFIIHKDPEHKIEQILRDDLDLHLLLLSIFHYFHIQQILVEFYYFLPKD